MRRLNLPYSLVIFDCDGVLVDSELLACEVLAEGLRRYGVAADVPYVIEHFLGRGLDAVRVHAEQINVWLPGDFEADIAQRLLGRFAEELRPIGGVGGVIEQLASRICVASSSHMWRVRRSLALTGLDTRFGPNVFTVDMVARGKPAPDLFLYAAERMAVSTQRCLVIEDSLSGVQAACAAGMTAWGFTGGSHYAGRENVAESLLSAGAQRTFDDMSAFWPAPSLPYPMPERAS